MEPLITAVYRQNLSTLRALLAQGADPNGTDDMGRTSLTHAAVDGLLEFVQALIDGGAVVDLQDRLGMTALHYAALYQHTEIATALITAHATIDVEDKRGNTPLWHAVSGFRGDGAMITLLRAAGANPGRRNRDGKSPVDVARLVANYDIEQFFD